MKDTMIVVLLLLSKVWFSVAKGIKPTKDPDIVTPYNSNFELKRTSEEIETTLKKHGIIPDLLEKAPNETVYVEWIDGPCALLGNEITEIHDLECRPLWLNYKNIHRKKHTMLMLGLDEPSSTNRSSSLFLYWLIGNIPPYNWDNVPGTDYVKGEMLADYREPTPLRGTGLHRYVFLVYTQESETVNFTMSKLEYGNVTERLNFQLKDFVQKHELGDPYAVNFFLAQWQLPPYMDSADLPLSTVEFKKTKIEVTTDILGK